MGDETGARFLQIEGDVDERRPRQERPLLRYIDWIWRIRGNLTLEPGLSRDEAFARLDPLFRQAGTSHDVTGDTLVFRKKDQAAQDRMSVFDGGILQIEKSAAGSVLRYNLTSRALLFCFLVPLLFLGFAQLTIALGKYEKAAEAAAGKSGKDKDKEKPEVVRQLHPIDKFLGAPEPEKKDPKKPKKEDDKRSPTRAYVFAAIFATLYVVGRILEAWLVRGLFRKKLQNL